jgi:hypothetical protein
MVSVYACVYERVVQRIRGYVRMANIVRMEPRTAWMISVIGERRTSSFHGELLGLRVPWAR